MISHKKLFRPNNQATVFKVNIQKMLLNQLKKLIECIPNFTMLIMLIANLKIIELHHLHFTSLRSERFKKASLQSNH